MRILIAPDKFKGCLSAAEVADAISAGVLSTDKLSIDKCPLADGGEGTVAALISAMNGRLVTRRVTGPLPDMKVDAAFGMLPDGTAVVEMSAASGLALLREEERAPFRTTTYGTGELLVEAAKLGATKIILGIGGSATVDGGIGCAQACGLPVILRDEGPADVHEPLVGEDLRRVVLVKHGRGSPLDHVKIEVASDVTNPLCGSNGAARVFGPQKGATPEQVLELDRLLGELAQRCEKMDVAQQPGAGAAGGLGFAMIAFFNAALRPGFEIVAEAVNLRERVAQADLCITGEGRLDVSSLSGKAPIGLARVCREMNVPCLALVGSVEEGVDFSAHFDGVRAISDGRDVASAKAQARELLSEAAAEVIRNLPNRRPSGSG
jgi:glycerate kinase